MTVDKAKLMIKDRLLLLISAIAVALGLFFFEIKIDGYGVRKEWKLFIEGCFMYAIISLYAIHSINKIKKYIFVHLLLILLLLSLPMFISYYIFKIELLPMPVHRSAYIFATIILVPGTSMAFEWLSRNMVKLALGKSN